MMIIKKKKKKLKKKEITRYEQRFKANDNISYNYTIHAFSPMMNKI